MRKFNDKDSIIISRAYQDSIKNFQAVDLEDAADVGLAYLMRVEQFELLSTLIVVF